MLHCAIPVDITKLLESDLMIKLMSLDDRTGDKLREKCLKKPGAFLKGQGLARVLREGYPGDTGRTGAPEVHDQADALESVEGNANGKRDVAQKRLPAFP